MICQHCDRVFRYNLYRPPKINSCDICSITHELKAAGYDPQSATTLAHRCLISSKGDKAKLRALLDERLLP